MALYTEKSFKDISDDWNAVQRLEQQRLQREAQERQRAAEQQYNAAQQKAANAQSKQRAGGLAGILQGIGESIGNVGTSIYDMFGTGVASISDLISGNHGKNYDDWKQYMKKNVYGDENMSDKDYYWKSAGKALDAASTVADFIPGVGATTRMVMNPIQGGISGVAQELIDNGENATLEGALKRGVVGGAAGLTGDLVNNKLTSRALTNPATSKIGKALQSNVGRAAVSGATAGAVGGGLSTALEGGDLGQVLSGAAQGASSGAIGGGTMAGTMGLIGNAADWFRPKNGNNVVAEIPETTVTKKAVVEPEIATPTKRGIAVTDYDAGTQKVNVKRPNANTGEYRLAKNSGSTLDGILGPNNKLKLPNAEKQTSSEILRKASGGDYSDVADYLKTMDVDTMPEALKELKNYADAADYEALRAGAREMADNRLAAFDGTMSANKTNMPDLDRQQYYEDTIGKLKAQGGQMSAADVPDYMQSHLRNDEARKSGYVSDNETILREFFNDDNSDLRDLYDRYAQLAQAANANEIYTPDNIEMALRADPALNNRLTNAFVDDMGLRKTLEVGGNPSLRQNVDVALLEAPSNETIYTKRTLAPKTPAQAEQNLPAVRGQVAPAVQEEVPLIQKGTPEYEAIQRQEYLDNRQRELRNVVTDGIRGQYGTIRLNDRINGLDDAIMELAGYGLTKRSQIDGFANRITGANGEMSKAIRKAMNDSGKTSGRLDIDMPEVYRQAGASGNKAAMEKISSEFNSRGKKYTVDADGNMNRSDMYDFGRELEKEGYRMIERGGRTQNNVTEAYGEGMKILGENYIAKATEGVDMRNYINANKLKNVLPGNKAWANHVDEVVPTIKTVSEARSFMAAPTKLSLLADAAEYNKGTYGSNVGNFAKDGTQAIRAMTSSNPAKAGAQYVAAKTLDSDFARQKVINNALKNLKKIEAGGNGRTGIKGMASNIGEKISNFSNAINNDRLQNTAFGDYMNRQLTRRTGLSEASKIGTTAELAQAQADANAAINDYQNAATDYQTAMANTQGATTSRGAQQLQTLSDAMDRALAAGDITAYGQLADLYKKAYSVYGEKEPKALSANQAKALTGLQQVEQLSQMTPDAGTALANSPLGFLVNMTGGNEYANQAQSLALTLGYLQSGANITPREAENIGKSYVPTAYDSEQTRQQKLARARQLLNNYLGDTTALTQ